MEQYGAKIGMIIHVPPPTNKYTNSVGHHFIRVNNMPFGHAAVGRLYYPRINYYQPQPVITGALRHAHCDGTPTFPPGSPMPC